MRYLLIPIALCLLIILLSGCTYGLYKAAQAVTIVVLIVLFVVLAVGWASKRDVPPA